MEIELLNPYMMMSINDAHEAEVNDKMATFTLRQLVIDINSKLDRKDFIDVSLIRVEEQHTFYDSSDLNQSRTLKRVRSNLFDNAEVRRESFKIDQSKSLSRQNSSKSLINFNGERIVSATFVTGKDGTVIFNQEPSTLTPPNEKKKPSFYITVSKPDDLVQPGDGLSSSQKQPIQLNHDQLVINEQTHDDGLSQMSSVIIDYYDQDEPEFDPNDIQSAINSVERSVTPARKSQKQATVTASRTNSLLGISEYDDDQISFDPNDMASADQN